jgi:hypothetical protein
MSKQMRHECKVRVAERVLSGGKLGDDYAGGALTRANEVLAAIFPEPPPWELESKIGRSIAWGQDKWWRRDKFKPVLQTLEYLVALDEGQSEDAARIRNNWDRPHVCQQVASELPQIIAKVGKSKRELLDIVSSQMERVREAEAG